MMMKRTAPREIPNVVLTYRTKKKIRTKIFNKPVEYDEETAITEPMVYNDTVHYKCDTVVFYPVTFKKGFQCDGKIHFHKPMICHGDVMAVEITSDDEINIHGNLTVDRLELFSLKVDICGKICIRESLHHVIN